MSGEDPVTEIQKRRLVAAAVQTIEETGYARMTVARIVARARVSRRTFYDVFVDCEECFLAAFEQTHLQIWGAMSEGCYSDGRWREQVRSGLARLLVFIEQEPGLAKLWIVEALGGGARVLARRAEALEQFADVVRRGRLAADGARRPPDIVALGVVGGVFAVLHTRLRSGFEGSPTELLNPLMSMIVLPYLGPRVARRELKRLLPEPPDMRPGQQASDSSDVLEGINVRVTYRTVQVLKSIARHPGSSNRAIAEMAGILDDGQVSRLLSRLERLELVENFGGGRRKGLANAWRLTPKGAHLARASRTREDRGRPPSGTRAGAHR